MVLRPHLAILALMLPLAAATATSAAAEPHPTDAQVREAARRIYVHGMTAEIAADEIGPSGVPALLRLLEDASFPRRDNVVAFLAYLGGRETTAPLEQLLARGVPRGVPEEERARLLVPHALGRIAGRGDTAALDALL